MTTTASVTITSTTLELQHEIEQFLFHEAALADEHAYKAWQALWAPELLYWVPCNADQIDPSKQVSLIFDDRPRLEERLYRLGTKHAHSQNPRSRLSRVVSNVRLLGFDPASGGEVSSRFNLTEARADRITVWAGRQHHVLERHGDTWLMREKRVYLVNNDSLMGNMTFII